MNETNSLNKIRLDYLDILRGFGIIFIVIGHISTDETVLKWLFSFHVPLFFFAAGAVYKKRSVLSDLKRRAATVVVPYFTFGALELIYWQLLERRFRPSEMGFGQSALGLLMGNYDYLDFNTHLWFLPCFFVTVVLFNILTNVGGKKLAYGISAVMSIIFIFLPMPELFWGINRVFKYIGFYAVGSLFSDINAAEVIGKQKNIVKIICAILLIAANAVLSYFGITEGVMYFVTALLGTCGVFIVSLMIGKWRPLQYLGRISLVILCLHGPVYRVVLKLISMITHVETEFLREKLYWVIPVAALTIAICVAAYEIIVRTVPFIIGKKRVKKSTNTNL